MNKYNKTELCGLPSIEELRENLASEKKSAMMKLAQIFDRDTFVETSAYATRAYSDFVSTEKDKELEGVVTGYGAIDGKLVFAFAEDDSRMGGMIDERHAKKITDLYALAIANGAPVIGIFASDGTDVFNGTSGIAAYAKIMAAVSNASGKIPQIAYVAGNCIGTACAIASMFDFVVKADDASFYVNSPLTSHTENAQACVLSFSGTPELCAGFIRNLVSFIPDNSAVGVIVSECSDNLNRMLGELNFSGDALSAIATVTDSNVYYEIAHDFEPAVSTAFAAIGGVKCGIVATSFSKDEGRISAAGARKIAKFVNYCDAFSIPVVTLVDSLGLAISEENEKSYFAAELAKLAFAYASATTPKVTVIMGHAIGAAFALLGSKSLGADMVYATHTSEIGALAADSGVAFAWDKYITLEKSRADLVAEWKASVSSPAVAAASGEIDNIITVNELRARICSALLMLAAKNGAPTARRKVLPL